MSAAAQYRLAQFQSYSPNTAAVFFYLVPLLLIPAAESRPIRGSLACELEGLGEFNALVIEEAGTDRFSWY